MRFNGTCRSILADSEFSYLRGAILSLGRPYGKIIYFHYHQIGLHHFIHHISQTIPYYHAKVATVAFKTALPKAYLYYPNPIHLALWHVASNCITVERKRVVDIVVGVILYWLCAYSKPSTFFYRHRSRYACCCTFRPKSTGELRAFWSESACLRYKGFLLDLGMQSQGDVLEIGPKYRVKQCAQQNWGNLIDRQKNCLKKGLGNC